MHRSTLIALLIPLLMLTIAMAYRYYSNDSLSQPSSGVDSAGMDAYIHEKIEKLQDLGIDAASVEAKLCESFRSFPAEFLVTMEYGQLDAMLLTQIAWLLYEQDGSMPQTRQFFTFDVECMDPDCMYTDFLNSISEIAGEDLVITDIVEDTSQVDYASGVGTQSISFTCNGKSYRYDATVHTDWFDTGMLTYMDHVISEQQTGKNLYVTSDGYQECIVFYRDKDWVKRFHKSMGLRLERP